MPLAQAGSIQRRKTVVVFDSKSEGICAFVVQFSARCPSPRAFVLLKTKLTQVSSLLCLCRQKASCPRVFPCICLPSGGNCRDSMPSADFGLLILNLRLEFRLSAESGTPCLPQRLVVFFQSDSDRRSTFRAKVREH